MQRRIYVAAMPAVPFGFLHAEHAWDLRRPKFKQAVGAFGYAGPPVTGTPSLRAEILFIGNRAHPMRPDPA